MVGECIGCADYPVSFNPIRNRDRVLDIIPHENLRRITISELALSCTVVGLVGSLIRMSP